MLKHRMTEKLAGGMVCNEKATLGSCEEAPLANAIESERRNRAKAEARPTRYQ
jgi:hypothetical protein